MTEKTEQRKLWDIQLEILDVIDEVCRENELHYSLYGGSLLGAVRHQGFIPWDDDLDVCMSRIDYERFLDLWKDEDHPGYLLQNKRNTPSFTQSFTKIRKDKTAFLQFEWERNRYHTGIFVDVFPIDRCPTSFAKSILFRLKCAKYQLFTREFIPKEAHLVIRTISRILLLTTSKEARKEYRERFEKELIAMSLKKELPTVGIETLRTAVHILPADLFAEYTFLPFENKEYECFAKWDECLTVQYGDYMQFPPEKDRVWKHKPICISFEHNYGDAKQ